MSSSSAPRPATSFVARAKQLKIPFLIGDPARAVLVDAMVRGADKLALSKCVEPAAALAWARANIDAAPEWLDLPAPMLKRVRDLYDAPFKAAWSVDQQIHAIRCSVRAAMPAVVLILPPQVLVAVGGIPQAAAAQPLAGNINAGRAPGVGVAAQLPALPLPLPPGAPHLALGAGSGGFGGLPAVGLGIQLGAGGAAQNPIVIPGTPLTSAFLKANIPRGRLRPLCIFLDWSMADRAAYAKAHKLVVGTSDIGDELEQDPEFPAWAQRIRLDYTSEEEIRARYDGKNLAIIAQWEPSIAERATAKTRQFMNKGDQTFWLETKAVLHSDVGISGSALDELQAMVQNKLAVRALECAAEFGALGGLSEVILQTQAQSASLYLLWTAYAARSRSRFSGRIGAAWHTNQMWFHLLSEFMEQHIMNEPVERRGPSDPSASSSRKRIGSFSDQAPGCGSTFQYPPGFGGSAPIPFSPVPGGPASLYNTIQAPSPAFTGPAPQGQWSFQGLGAPAASSAQALPAYAPPPFLGPPPPYVGPVSPLVVPPLPMRPAAGRSRSQQGPSAGGLGGFPAGPSSKLFVGWPTSSDIIGSLATWPPGTPVRNCRSCGAPAHMAWECPSRYAQVFGVACPGFTAAGARDPAAWVAGELTPAARQAWLDFGARFNLLVARAAPPGVPAF